MNSFLISSLSVVSGLSMLSFAAPGWMREGTSVSMFVAVALTVLAVLAAPTPKDGKRGRKDL